VFVGVHERQLDERGRVALPSQFRGDLGDHCYLFLGDDGCVTVRSEESFQTQALELIEQVKRGEATRDRKRAFSSSAVHATIDKQGRVTIDSRLRDHAGIDPQGKVMVLGSLDQIEIWDPESYRASEEAGQLEIAGGSR
jgi:transcriptional regulator MraZ